MIWVILAILGIPRWLCAVGIFALVRNRRLRRRHGDIPVRVLRPDVFTWRGSPAAWNEELSHVVDATVRGANSEEQKALRGLGDTPVVAALTIYDGAVLHVATAPEHLAALAGAFPAESAQS